MAHTIEPSGRRSRRLAHWKDGLDVLASVAALAAAGFLVWNATHRSGPGRAPSEIKPPTELVSLDGASLRGSPQATIAIIEYSDFQCPYCKRGFETIEELKKKYGTKMMFVFKHLPLPFHPMALPAAKRFEALALHSSKKAYAFHDEVFKNQEGISGGEAFLDGIVKKVGGNVEQVKKDMESPKVKAHLDADGAEAKKFNISGTPGFVVMGISLKGAYPAPSFENIIEKRLADNKK